jgi:hypothetical protein
MSSETSMYFSYFPRMRAMWLVSIKCHLFVVVDFSNFDFQNLYNRSCNINVMILIQLGLLSLSFIYFPQSHANNILALPLLFFSFFLILFKCHPCDHSVEWIPALWI